MRNQRLWPTFTYILACAIAWILQVNPEFQGNANGVLIAALLLILVSIPLIFLIPIFHDIVDPLHVARPTPWAPNMTENEIFLLCQVFNLLLIFFLTSNIFSNKNKQS